MPERILPKSAHKDSQPSTAEQQTSKSLLQTPEQERLSNSVSRFVFKRAYRFSNLARTAGIPVELDDLAQAGSIGTVEASIKYDPSQGMTFLTYASFWIDRRMREALGENLPYGRVVGKQIAQIDHAHSKLLSETGKTPTVDDIASVTGLKAEQQMSAYTASNIQFASSLDIPITHNGTDSANNLGDTLPSKDNVEEDVLERIEAAETTRALKDAINALRPKHALVIQLYFFEDLNQEDIAIYMGKTQQLIPYYVKCALAQLKNLIGPSAQNEPAENVKQSKKANDALDDKIKNLRAKGLTPLEIAQKLRTAEDIDKQVAALRSKQATIKEIAIKLHLSPDSVHRTVGRLLESSRMQPMPTSHLSPEETAKLDARVAALRNNGVSIRGIAKNLGENPNAIRRSLKRLKAVEAVSPTGQKSTPERLNEIDADVAVFRNRGLTNQEISEKMGVDISVVRHSVERLLAKGLTERRHAYGKH